MEKSRCNVATGLALAAAIVYSLAIMGCSREEPAPKADSPKAGASAKPAGAKATDGKKPFTVAYVGFSSTTPFWITMKDAAEKAAKEQGVTFKDLTAAKPEMDQQKAALDNAILSKVDGLLVGAVDSRGLKDTFDKAQKAGIPIVTVDTRVEHPAVRAHVATDNEAGAALAGEYIVKRLNGKGKVLILGGTVGHQTGDARRKGVEDACKKAGMQVTFRPADWSDSKSNEITQAELTAQPDLGAIFGACDPQILAAKQVVKNKGKLGQIVLVGFDGNKDALKAIKAGEVDATVMQHPEEMGKQGLELLVKVLKGESVPANVPIAPTLIEKGNVGQYFKE